MQTLLSGMGGFRIFPWKQFVVEMTSRYSVKKTKKHKNLTTKQLIKQTNKKANQPARQKTPQNPCVTCVTWMLNNSLMISSQLRCLCVMERSEVKMPQPASSISLRPRSYDWQPLAGIILLQRPSRSQCENKKTTDLSIKVHFYYSYSIIHVNGTQWNCY